MGRVIARRLHGRVPLLALCTVGVLTTACGTVAAPPSLSKLAPDAARPKYPNQTPGPTAASTDPVQLVTYLPGSACESVAVATPIDKVPTACAQAWSRFAIGEVPGQDLLKKTPHFPTVSVKTGLDPILASRLAVALWRTESFHWFALGTGQLGVVDGLGPNYFFREVGIEEQALQNHESVSTPECHFFPVAIRVVPLAQDLAAALHQPSGTPTVVATYQGPCYATAVDAKGNAHQLFSFNGKQSSAFVGVIGRGDPEGAVLEISGVGECDQPAAKSTCAQ